MNIKPKKLIGFIALGVAAVVLITWILVVTMNSNFLFKHKGVIALIMIVWIGSLVTAAICLIGDIKRYFGRKEAEGFTEGIANSRLAQQSQPVKEIKKYCPYCGKALTEDTPFCPGCGHKLS